MAVTKTQFAYRVDRWDANDDDILEQVGASWVRLAIG
jgi:hypothetical protein